MPDRCQLITFTEERFLTVFLCRIIDIMTNKRIFLGMELANFDGVKEVLFHVAFKLCYEL